MRLPKLRWNRQNSMSSAWITLLSLDADWKPTTRKQKKRYNQVVAHANLWDKRHKNDYYRRYREELRINKNILDIERQENEASN